MLSRCSLAVPVLLLSGFLVPAWRQSQSQSQPSNKPYTIQTTSRVVLTDVTVTDKNGNPLHGLPESAFQIFDNNKAQTIDSFEEHSSAAPAVEMEPVAAAKGVYSNDYLLHLPPALSIILVDIANLSIAEQMYLYYELNKFFKEQPLVQPVAIYLRAGNGCFLVQNFTTDRTLLLNAVRKAIPRIPPDNPEYLTDIDTLNQIAGQLRQLPGRKNVLWFSGGSTFYLRDDFAMSEDPAAWRALYDLMEQARIAVYPIDARGLMNLAIHLSSLLWAQQVKMNETARATGGQAFYNNNGLLEITNHILSSDGSFYTLTYAPRDFHFDNKWHKIKVTLNVPGYQLGYRRGYFADGSSGAAQRPQESKARTRLMPGGTKVELPEKRSVPIIFQARVLAASDPEVTSTPAPTAVVPAPPPKKGSVRYSVRYSFPVNELVRQTVNGKPEVIFVVAAVVLNSDDWAVDHHGERVTLMLNEDTVRLHPDAPVTVDEQLNLKKGDQYLFLAVWDVTSGSLGTLQIPVQVPKPGKAASSN